MVKPKRTVNVDLTKLKQFRESNGYSISDIAIILGYKTPTGYWLLEKGSRQCSVDVLYMLAELYKCNMKDLLVPIDQ